MKAEEVQMINEQALKGSQNFYVVTSWGGGGGGQPLQ
jgi:hypothetical protein